MTQIAAPEVVAGIVGFLDQSALQSNKLIEHTVFQKTPRPGPFICIKTDGGVSWWTAITTQSRTTSGVGRVPTPQAERTGTHPQWLNDDQYLNDGASVYFGPTSEFCQASKNEITKPLKRSFASAVAVDSLVSEVKAQSGRQVTKLSRNPY